MLANMIFHQSKNNYMLAKFTSSAILCPLAPPGHLPVLLPVPASRPHAGVCQLKGLPAAAQLPVHPPGLQPPTPARRHAPAAEAQEPRQVCWWVCCVVMIHVIVCV